MFDHADINDKLVSFEIMLMLMTDWFHLVAMVGVNDRLASYEIMLVLNWMAMLVSVVDWYDLMTMLMLLISWFSLMVMLVLITD